VLEATLAAMTRLGAHAEDTIAVLGPTISGRAYEVGPEFVARFIAASERNRIFFQPSPADGHAYFDLPAYVVSRLRASGVGQALDVDLCTYSDERRFFSFRRATHRGEPDYGRNLSAIGLLPV
jgi:copper oxidase (laccase) domain-containing protein